MKICSSSERTDLEPVAASIIRRSSVRRLVRISNEVDNPFERFEPFGGRSSVRELLQLHLQRPRDAATVWARVLNCSERKSRMSSVEMLRRELTTA